MAFSYARASADTGSYFHWWLFIYFSYFAWKYFMYLLLQFCMARILRHTGASFWAHFQITISLIFCPCLIEFIFEYFIFYVIGFLYHFEYIFLKLAMLRYFYALRLLPLLYHVKHIIYFIYLYTFPLSPRRSLLARIRFILQPFHFLSYFQQLHFITQFDALFIIYLYCFHTR